MERISLPLFALACLVYFLLCVYLLRLMLFTTGDNWGSRRSLWIMTMKAAHRGSTSTLWLAPVHAWLFMLQGVLTTRRPDLFFCGLLCHLWHKYELWFWYSVTRWVPFLLWIHFYKTYSDGLHWYIQLPDNISELNDYMCGPLNRKGRLCSECKDGYGLATTSVGFQYFECSKCAGTWYGVPLFLFLEMFPLTVLYLVILLVQVNITSSSITCFSSQVGVIALDHTMIVFQSLMHIYNNLNNH